MKQVVRRMLERVGYRMQCIRYTPQQLLDSTHVRELHFDDIVCRRMYEHGREFTFIQIGAYDGISTDPINKYIERCGWRGVMLEPQPRPAAKLRDLYRNNSAIVILEAALDQARGSRSLYTVDSDGLPEWAGGMASFNKNHVTKHGYLIPDIQSKVRELTVPCLTFDDVLATVPSGRLDLLQVDAEGADGYLISLFPFERIRPAIIHFETKNMTRVEQEKTLNLLADQGYLFSRSGNEDTLAVLAND